jgi:hypothetical protein
VLVNETPRLFFGGIIAATSVARPLRLIDNMARFA